MLPFRLTDEFYLEVGKLTAGWAQVEIPLEFITGILFMFAGGTKRLAKRLPRALDQKIQFCRGCLAELPQLGPFREGLTMILDRVEELSEHRHRIVHGIVDNFTPVPLGMIIIRKLEYGKPRAPIYGTPNVAPIHARAEEGYRRARRGHK